MIETCEPCAACGEITLHSRRRFAPLRWTAAVLAALTLASGAEAVLSDGEASIGLFFAWLLVLAPSVLALIQLDLARRWDLSCNRCRARAREGRQRWRLPLRSTTIDVG